jgi:hypothetical protein
MAWRCCFLAFHAVSLRVDSAQGSAAEVQVRGGSQAGFALPAWVGSASRPSLRQTVSVSRPSLRQSAANIEYGSIQVSGISRVQVRGGSLLSHLGLRQSVSAKTAITVGLGAVSACVP